VKPFFASATAVEHGYSAHPLPPQATPSPIITPAAVITHSARLAVYDSAAAAPRVTDIEEHSVDAFIASVSSTTYQAASDLGGDIPYTAIREITENLIHADFTDPVVSVMNHGRAIRFADRGPGISDKKRAVMPGFSTASGSMKSHIRGVGSGLPIVREYLDHHSGSLEIDDNLGGGAVITLKTNETPVHAPLPPSEPLPASLPLDSEIVSANNGSIPRLSTRHKKVLSLVMEVGAAGPTLVSKELSVGLSTAHRDLAFLEHSGLIVADDGGKRVLTDAGSEYLDTLFE